MITVMVREAGTTRIVGSATFTDAGDQLTAGKGLRVPPEVLAHILSLREEGRVSSIFNHADRDYQWSYTHESTADPFAVGDRVILAAVGPPEFDPNPEERGTVVQCEGRGMYVVEIDEEYARHEDDDCIREVSRDQMRKE